MTLKLLALLALLVPAVATAEVPDPPPLNGKPVVDAADIIPADTEARLNARLLDIESKSKHQVAVLTTPSLGGYSIEEYSLHAARTYALGDKDADNGILITVAPIERKTRIETGTGEQMAFTDLEAGRVVDNVMLPHFRNGDYAEGIEEAVETIAGAIVPLTPEQLAIKQRAEAQAAARHAATMAHLKDAGVFGLILGGVFGAGWLVWWLLTAPIRRREREEEERQEAERLRLYAEQRERERQERIKREAAAARRAAEAAKRERARRAALTPEQRRAEDAAKRKAAREAAAAEAERQRKRRRSSYSPSSGYSSSFGGGYSSSSYGGGGGFSSGGFSGGGGSFGGGGASGGW